MAVVGGKAKGEIGKNFPPIGGPLVSLLKFLHDFPADEPVGEDHAGIDRADGFGTGSLEDGGDAFK